MSWLTFKFLSYFKLIFVCGVRVCSNFIDLHAVVQWEDASFVCVCVICFLSF